MTKLFSVILSVGCAATVSVVSVSIASAYSQDPRSCEDPKTQYPSNPPCAVPSPFSTAGEK